VRSILALAPNNSEALQSPMALKEGERDLRQAAILDNRAVRLNPTRPDYYRRLLENAGRGPPNPEVTSWREIHQGLPIAP